MINIIDEMGDDFTYLSHGEFREGKEKFTYHAQGNRTGYGIDLKVCLGNSAEEVLLKLSEVLKEPSLYKNK